MIGVSLTESSAMLAATLGTLLVVVGAQVLESGGMEVGGSQRAKWIGYGAVMMAGFAYAAASLGAAKLFGAAASVAAVFFPCGGLRMASLAGACELAGGGWSGFAFWHMGWTGAGGGEVCLCG